MCPSTCQPTVIFYRYKESPFAHKVDLLLAIRKIPHFTVLVARMPPRPELLLLGIPYRRVPVLAINDTVYCDTFRIAEAIEALYPDSDDHPSLFPKDPLDGIRNVAPQKLLVQFWTDRPLFKLAVGLLPWKKMPEAFIDDRSRMLGGRIDVNKIEHSKPHTISQLQVHLALLEQQLQESNTEFLLGTDYPGLLDVSAYFALNWLQELGVSEQVFRTNGQRVFERVTNWMKQVKAFYDRTKASSSSILISGEEANTKIPEPEHMANLKPVTVDDVLFRLGSLVSVIPDDSGKVPTLGTLVGIDQTSLALIVKRRDGSGRTCKVCFPRMGFSILSEDVSAAKL